MSATDRDFERAEAVHEEYLAEVERLVDAQAAALFDTITAVVQRSIGQTADGRAIDVRREGRTLTLTAGDRSTTFTVEAVTDLPEGADRAREFPGEQARCIVRASDGTTRDWILHRVGAGDAVQYAWMQAQQGAPITEAEIDDAIRPLTN